MLAWSGEPLETIKQEQEAHKNRLGKLDGSESQNENENNFKAVEVTTRNTVLKPVYSYMCDMS